MELEILANTSLSQLCLSESSDKLQQLRCPHSGCGRDFTSKRNLVDHVRGHHQGSKPHVCDHAGCGKSFLRPAHLQIHMRIHTGEKPFVCSFEGCGKRWNQKSALKQHMRSHTGEKPFLCSIEGCGKNFSTSSSCKRHILTHMKEGQNPPSPIQISEDRSPLSKRKSTDSLSDSSSDDEYDLPLTKRPSRELAQPKMTLDFILN